MRASRAVIRAAVAGVLALVASATVPVYPQAAADAGAPAPAGTTETPEFTRRAERAREAHAAQRLDEARGLFEEALELEPGWTEGRFALGTVLYSLDEYHEARTAFRRVAAEHPENGTALAFKGMCEFELGKHERALDDLQLARRLGLGENPEVESVANYHAAILLTRFGRYDDAFEILKEFAQGENDSPSMIVAFGLAILRMPYLPSEAPVDRRELILMAGRAGYLKGRARRSPSTERAFEILVQRYPEDPGARYAWAAYLLLDEPDQAIEQFRRVLRLDPAHVPAMLQLALHFIKDGRFEEAVPLAEEAATIEPDLFVARNALGRSLLETGEVERAIPELEAAVRLAPDNPQMHFHLARAYQQAGRTEDAKRARDAFKRLDQEQRSGGASGVAPGDPSRGASPSSR